MNVGIGMHLFAFNIHHRPKNTHTHTTLSLNWLKVEFKSMHDTSECEERFEKIIRDSAEVSFPFRCSSVLVSFWIVFFFFYFFHSFDDSFE